MKEAVIVWNGPAKPPEPSGQTNSCLFLHVHGVTFYILKDDFTSLNRVVMSFYFFKVVFNSCDKLVTYNWYITQFHSFSQRGGRGGGGWYITDLVDIHTLATHGTNWGSKQCQLEECWDLKHVSRVIDRRNGELIRRDKFHGEAFQTERCNARSLMWLSTWHNIFVLQIFTNLTGYLLFKPAVLVANWSTLQHSTCFSDETPSHVPCPQKICRVWICYCHGVASITCSASPPFRIILLRILSR